MATRTFGSAEVIAAVLVIALLGAVLRVLLAERDRTGRDATGADASGPDLGP